MADAGVPLFEIGATSGELRTTAAIDRESAGLCAPAERAPAGHDDDDDDDDDCELHLSVVVQPVDYLQVRPLAAEPIGPGGPRPAHFLAPISGPPTFFRVM